MVGHGLSMRWFPKFFQADICSGLMKAKGLRWGSGGLSAGGEGSMYTESGQLGDIGNREGGKGVGSAMAIRKAAGGIHRTK